MNSKQQAQQSDAASKQSRSSQSDRDGANPSPAKLPKTESDRAGSARKNDQPGSAPESGDKSP